MFFAIVLACQLTVAPNDCTESTADASFRGPVRQMVTQCMTDANHMMAVLDVPAGVYLKAGCIREEAT